jgi:arabinogalactan endo-1,4-beta-galactosidase
MHRGVKTAAMVTLSLAAFGPDALSDDGFIRGVDFSSVARIEAAGGIYTENGTPTDPFAILSGHGVNYVRIRTWHSPVDGENNLEETLALARRISDAGLGLLLNVHYSDTWADPGHQTKPAAWQGLSFETLKDSVYEYTRERDHLRDVVG